MKIKDSLLFLLLMVYIRMQEEFKTISCVYICIFVQSFTVGHETEEEG